MNISVDTQDVKNDYAFIAGSWQPGSNKILAVLSQSWGRRAPSHLLRYSEESSITLVK